KAAVAAFAGIAASSVAEFSKLDKGVREVATLIGDATDSQIKALQTDIRLVATEYGQAGTDVAKAFYDSLSAGVADPTNVRDFANVAAKFATAGATEIGAGVDLLSSALNAFKIDTADAMRVSDVFFGTVKAGKTTVEEIAASFSDIGPAAAAAGVSIEDVSGWLAQLTLSGTPTEQATTQIKGALAALSKEGTKLSNNFKEIAGKNFRQFIAEGGSLEEAMALIQQQATNTGKGMFEMTGNIRAAQALLGVTGDNAERFSKTLGLVSDSAGATDTAFGVMNKSLDMQMRRFKAAVTDIQYTIGEALLPVVIPTLERLTVALPAMLDGISRGFDVASTAASNFLLPYARVINVVELVISRIHDLYTQFGGFRRVVNDVRDAALYVWEGLFELGSGVQQVVIPAITILGTVAIAALIPKLIALKTLIVAKAVALGALLAPVHLVIAGIAALSAGLVFAYLKFDTFREIVNTVGRAIRDGLVWAFEKVVAFIRDPLIPTVQAIADILWGKAVEAFQAVANVVTTVVMPVLHTLRDNAISIFGSMVSAVKDWGATNSEQGTITASVWDTVRERIKRAVDFVVTLWRTNFMPAIRAVGTVVKTVAEGIVWAFDTLIRPALRVLVEAFRLGFEVIRTVIELVVWPLIKLFAEYLKDTLEPLVKLVAKAIAWAWENVVQPAIQAAWKVIKP
ncbi:MAG: phage tail tape measure protein, partial [Gammaproteobacteria bacterium]|nr:phage tail tape measure protein [Gammaproteobacteria bacterium]